MIDFIQISLQIIIILIGLYLALFKSYFQEKGKNIATKEDIEEITQKVEKIKNNLNYSTQTKLSIKSEEKKALIEFYEKYYQFQNYLSDVSLVGIHEDNKEKIRDIEEKIDQLKSDYDIASAKMELLVDNDKFIDDTKQLKLRTIEYHGFVSDFIGKIEILFIEIRQVLNSTPIEQQKDEIAKLYEKRSKLYRELGDKKLNFYKEHYELEKNIRIEIYKMLQTLIIS